MNDQDRRIVLFTSAAHALVHTYELSIPILMTVWLVEFSTTAATLGLLVTIGYGLFGVGALPGGVLVDRFGSRPLIVACLIGMAVAFAIAGLAGSLIALGLAIALWGLFASVYHPAGLALLSKAVENRGMAMGYHGIGGNLGIALGPLATALLLLRFDWRTVTLALTLPAIVVAIFAVFVDLDASPRAEPTTDGGDETDPAGREGSETDTASREQTSDSAKGEISIANVASDTRSLATLGFGMILLVVTLDGLYYRAFLTFLPDLLGDVLAGLIDVQLVDPESPYADEFDVARYLYVAILTVGVAGQYIGGRMASRMPSERGLAYALGTLAVLAVLFVPASGNPVTFVAVSLLLGVALFSVQPLSQTAVAAYSAPEARGLSFGYTFLAIFGVGALGASLAGAVLTYASVRELFVLLAVIAATGATVSRLLLKVGERRD